MVLETGAGTLNMRNAEAAKEKRWKSKGFFNLTHTPPPLCDRFAMHDIVRLKKKGRAHKVVWPSMSAGSV